MLTCRQVQQELDPTLDEHARHGPVDHLNQHLAGCADCRRYRDELVLLDSLLFEIGASQRPESNSHFPVSGRPEFTPLRRALAWRPALAAAGLLFVLLLLLTDSTTEMAPEPVAFAFECDNPGVWVVGVPSSREDVHIVWLSPSFSTDDQPDNARPDDDPDNNPNRGPELQKGR